TGSCRRAATRLSPGGSCEDGRSTPSSAAASSGRGGGNRVSGVGKAAPTPRAWLGDAPYPWPRVDDVAEGDRLVGGYDADGKQIGVSTNAKPYLRLQLTDRGGESEGRVWEDADRLHELVAEGAFVGVRGRIES